MVESTGFKGVEMKEAKCSLCGRPILLCDACNKKIPKTGETVHFQFNDAWGFEIYNFCSVECMAKWLFDLAPTSPQSEPEEKGATGQIRIMGVDRYRFVQVIRKGVSHGS